MWINNEESLLVSKKCLYIDQIEKEEWWITDMGTFIQIYKNKDWVINNYFTRTKELFEKIDIYLKETYFNEIDEIKYLNYLYYNEKTWFSVDAIAKRLGHDVDHLYDFLTKILWWKLRDKNERTETWIKRRITSNNIIWLVKNRKNISVIALKKYNTELLSILEENVKIGYNLNSNKFNLEEYNKIGWKHRKIIYLMSIKLNIDIKKTIELINKLKKSISAKIIAREFNIKLLNFFESNDIEKLDITENNIEEIDNKYTFSKYNEKTYEEVDISKITKSDTKFRLTYDTENMKWINSIEALNELQKDTPEHIKKNLIKRLNDLEIVINLIYPNNLDIKGIDYIIYLYHIKKESFKKMSNHLTELWIRWPQGTLEKNVRLFWWER